MGAAMCAFGLLLTFTLQPPKPPKASTQARLSHWTLGVTVLALILNPCDGSWVEDMAATIMLAGFAAYALMLVFCDPIILNGHHYWAFWEKRKASS